MDFIKNFLKQTKGIAETKQIYQDIVDEIFVNEVTEISVHPEIVENINLKKDIVI